MSDINIMLKNERINSGFSQDYVAEQLGIRRTAITEIESGRRRVSTDELKKFCTLYRKSADFFLDLEKHDTKTDALMHYYNMLSHSERTELFYYVKAKAEMDKAHEEHSIYDSKRRQAILSQAGSGIEMLDVSAIENLRKEQIA